MFVDTSAWVALAHEKDQSHGAAKKLLEAHPHRRLVSSDYVFDETITRLRRTAGHSAAVRAGRSLRASLTVRIEHVTVADIDAAWALFERHSDQELSFTDCTSAIIMRRLGIVDVFGFDQDFVRLGFNLRPGHA